jgi:hypothetical protein
METMDLKKTTEQNENALKSDFYSEKSPKRNSFSNLVSAQILSAQDDAWNMYAAAMNTHIAGNAKWENLQIVAPAQLAEKIGWDDPDFGDFYFHKITSDLVNGPGATYNKSDKSFSTRYGDFLSDVSRPPIDPDAQAKMIKANDLLTADETRHLGLIDNLNLEWIAFDKRQRHSLPPSQWESFDSWWGTHAAAQISRSQEIRLSYFMTYESLLQKAFQGGEALAQMLDVYKDPKSKILVKRPQNSPNSLYGGKSEVFPYQISEDYAEWLKAARAGHLARLPLKIKRNSQTIDTSASQIAGGIGVFIGFFGAVASGHRTTVSIDTSDDSFEFSFDAVFKTFEIIPGEWYGSSAFDYFRSGPFYPGSPSDHLNATGALFGPRGFLSFRPIRMIVAFNPKVTLRLSRSSYHYFHQETHGFGAFCIGPFVLGAGSYYDSKTTIVTSDDNFTIDFEIKDYAILVASDSQAL